MLLGSEVPCNPGSPTRATAAVPKAKEPPERPALMSGDTSRGARSGRTDPAAPADREWHIRSGISIVKRPRTGGARPFVSPGKSGYELPLSSWSFDMSED